MNRVQIKIIKDALDCPEALTEWETNWRKELRNLAHLQPLPKRGKKKCL